MPDRSIDTSLIRILILCILVSVFVVCFSFWMKNGKIFKSSQAGEKSEF